MPDERSRQLILGAMARGQLPASLPRKTWGGFGDGHACCVCGRPVTSEQIETEFEAGGLSYHLHIQCFAAWEVAAASGRIAEPGLPLAQHDGYDFRDEHTVSRGPR
jgi:hypothetical protein